MQSFIQFLYTYGEEISLISGIITIISTVGTVISWLKIKAKTDFSALTMCQRELPETFKIRRYKVLARQRKRPKAQVCQKNAGDKKTKYLLNAERQTDDYESGSDIIRIDSYGTGISNNKISNSKIVLKNSSSNTVALICFFGFLSLTVICATICVVVYFVTH